MRLKAFLFSLLCFATAPLHANPLAWDSRSNPVEMVAENVRVLVGANASRVTGTYRFQLRKDLANPVRAKYVTVYVPVFLPNVQASLEQYAGEHGTPTVRVGSRRFVTKPWKDLTPSDAPAQVKLPRGWYTALFLCHVPLHAAGREFEAHVAYVQPHLPGGVSAYAAFHPPKAGAGKITFVAEPGKALRRAGASTLLFPATKEIHVTPRHRELIRVVPVSGAKPAADRQPSALEARPPQ